MAHRIDSHRATPDRRDYRAAQLELDELLGDHTELAESYRVDQLLEVIENYDAAVRCVPDWSGEPYANAA